MNGREAILPALAVAALFGASTPVAKLLVGEIDPWMLAGLLYLGSGLGLGGLLLFRRAVVPVATADRPSCSARCSSAACLARSC